MLIIKRFQNYNNKKNNLKKILKQQKVLQKIYKKQLNKNMKNQIIIMNNKKFKQKHY